MLWWCGVLPLFMMHCAWINTHQSKVIFTTTYNANEIHWSSTARLHLKEWVPPLLSVRHDSHMQSHQLLRLTLKLLLDEIWTFRHINIGIYSPALSVETQEPLEISSHLWWYNFSESYAISKVCLSLKTLWYTHKHVRVPDKTSDLNSFKTWLLKPFLDTVLYAKGNWSRIDRSTWFSTFENSDQLCENVLIWSRCRSNHCSDIRCTVPAHSMCHACQAFGYSRSPGVAREYQSCTIDTTPLLLRRKYQCS